MKKKIVLLMTVGVMALTGCGDAGTNPEGTNSGAWETVREPGTEQETKPETEAQTEPETVSETAGEDLATGEVNGNSEESPVGGYEVVKPEEQQYFNRCTWYKGEIPAQEFQESVLNQTERDNLRLLSVAEQEYDRQHPYPKMYQTQETASEDLNGDGAAEDIGYRVLEQETGEFLCEITVNGESYIANELSGPESDTVMTNPVMDCFYITDILEGDDILEIAVLDEGPSDDPVTYFYQYDGTLSCIGQVPGFPFTEMNGGLNGFNGYGVIAGRLRTDLIETAYLQGSWRYDGGRIACWDWGWYDFLPAPGHTLYEDLPVYFE